MAIARRRLAPRVAPPTPAATLGVVRAAGATGQPTASPLWLALRFADFARQVFGAASAEGVAVVEGEGARRAVIAFDGAAAAAGVRAGHSVAAALALLPALALVPRDPAREAATLARLAGWAQQFTPTVCLAAPDALLLEVRGSLRLFGGLEALAAGIGAGLDALGYQAALAVAPTPNAALWFARAGVPARIEGLEALGGPLGALPLAVAGFEPRAVAALNGVGVHALRDLARLPRDGLARRHGAALRQALDRALGRAPDPRAAFVAPPRFAGIVDLTHETSDHGWILHAAARLLAELCGGLAARGEGVRRLRVHLAHAPGEGTGGAGAPASEVMLGLLAPSRDAAHLERLLAERLARATLAGPVRAVGVEALEVEPLAAAPLALFTARAGAADGATAAAALIETLRARLGPDAVQGIACRADHRPERAQEIGTEIGVGYRINPGLFPIADAGGRVADASTVRTPSDAPRPAWLLEAPQPLPSLRGAPRLRGRPLALLAGPERIESGWWDEDDIARDYYLARAADGARLWVFRTRGRPAAWFLHGVFA